MQEYQIKRGYTKSLAESMIQGLRDQFGTEPAASGDGHYTVTYGALRRLEVWSGAGGKTLIVDTEANKDADDETIIDTNRRFRNYLQQVTGYTAKERAKKAQQALKGKE
ncbi:MULTISPECIES: DUF5611 family protein [unclassified Methanoculleus]|uniref:DUF5611 family protein n=1 Tax=unclassified Methanoculleus TaxID=2619537 RepID=UPI0025FBFEA2|nr:MULTISPECIES: DUF5611 family protein [unclassified Methanoculleus]MCK9318316.1 DUF5611 family protein [Methanoculleus sp.]MDD2253854.1 DUF5611 family protein [Methanoculleus sp.]MDD2786538.1 DUF5611 family protein [Methanoculleus sp.]MDD3215613.1 DUF5611 family protein [Methanoculleus sp.]MDD4313467.1 DUF5611 family protein [Methanoculleus sp.]